MARRSPSPWRRTVALAFLCLALVAIAVAGLAVLLEGGPERPTADSGVSATSASTGPTEPPPTDERGLDASTGLLGDSAAP